MKRYLLLAATAASLAFASSAYAQTNDSLIDQDGTQTATVNQTAGSATNNSDIFQEGAGSGLAEVTQIGGGSNNTSLIDQDTTTGNSTAVVNQNSTNTENDSNV